MLLLCVLAVLGETAEEVAPILQRSLPAFTTEAYTALRVPFSSVDSAYVIVDLLASCQCTCGVLVRAAVGQRVWWSARRDSRLVCRDL